MEPKQDSNIKLYFSDYFDISEEILKEYGAFNISLVADLPLFIDPFLLFHSSKEEYQKLHKNIITYLQFLKNKSSGSISPGLLDAWYCFPEVKQNWLGFTDSGNGGRGLGKKFASALNGNLDSIFKDFGQETTTSSSHLEKLCLIKEGVGRDNISDFATNLVKGFLLEYTQVFALKNINKEKLREVTIQKVKFNYKTETWESGKYTLPYLNSDYVILTPRDILTKDDIWINKTDLFDNFSDIPYAIPNEQLRAQLDNYFKSQLPPKEMTRGGKEKPYSQKDISKAVFETLKKFPEAIDYYIKTKEDKGERATSISTEKVEFSEKLFLETVKEFSNKLALKTKFYSTEGKTYEETKNRIKYLKDVIEKNDGYTIFYYKGNVKTKESDIQVMFKLVWLGSQSGVDREVNNGRGPVDYKISIGSEDSSLVEFKLARNKHLKKNIQRQLEIYKEANNTKKGFFVIVYFSESEFVRVKKIFKELEIFDSENIILIDARSDNKPSASTA